MYLSTHWTGFKSVASLVMNWKLPFHRPAAQSTRVCLNIAPIAFISVPYFLCWRRQIVCYLSLSYKPTALLSFQDWRVKANSMIINNKALPCRWIIFIILLWAVPLLQIFGIKGALHSVQDKDEQWLCAYNAMLVFSISLPITLRFFVCLFF